MRPRTKIWPRKRKQTYNTPYDYRRDSSYSLEVDPQTGKVIDCRDRD